MSVFTSSHPLYLTSTFSLPPLHLLLSPHTSNMPANTPHNLLTTYSLHVIFSKAKEADIDTSMLNSEQLTALSLAEDLNSFFLTGDPETSKTFTLLKIIKVLPTLLKPSQLGITASTGAAANRLQGQTIHSWAGLTSSEIITSGNFLQLPPIPLGGKSVQFAFQSLAWDAVFKENHIRLTTVYRQNEEAPVGSIVQLKVGAHIVLRKNTPLGPVCTLKGREQMLFPLVKFEIGSTYEHVLILDKEFVFQSVKGNKEYMAMCFQV
ncbi:hypothetical protein BDR03DRAFT_1016954 [Suillus americanus]|nr:hypothetical protein BDR03DRAFT_1016954 [Suillus americanus]